MNPLPRCERCNQHRNPADLLYGRCKPCQRWCRVPGCRGKHRARGYCISHYDRHVRRGGAARKPIRRSRDTAEDAAWLMSNGESYEVAARRLYPNSKRPDKSLERAIYRARQYERRAA